MTFSWHEKMGLWLKYQKSVMFNDIFHFVVSESHDKGVLYAHDTCLVIFIFLFIYFLQYLQSDQSQTYLLLIPAENNVLSKS